MNRKEEQFSWIVALPYNLFCAIAVMNIDIHNCTTFTQEPFIRNGVHGTSSHAIEDAKPTRFSTIQQAIDTSMVPWRSHYAKCIAISADEYAIHCVLNSTCGAPGSTQ
mmetsp:Transcript_17517/g.50465  ORF Transcript_17517/g.50465 Transcript_17517/m.50465 type:complete len:108 (+) Transcript_17517:767-1090(+)